MCDEDEMVYCRTDACFSNNNHMALPAPRLCNEDEKAICFRAAILLESVVNVLS